jgi:hippurate hydrolase
MLLGAAKYLCETRRFDGTAVVIFQPAEEGGAGGRAMCEDGLMERWNVQEVYGLHNMPGHPVGSFHIRPGAIMASADEFDVIIRGVGGHAAMPNKTVDPVVAASNVVQALQSIKSRNLDPVKQLVISVTSFRTETDAYNVISDNVHLKGTIRTLDPAVRDLAEDRFKPLVTSVAEAFGAKAEIDYRRGYPVTVNHDTETDYAADAAEAISGAVDRSTPQLMGGEDFAFMLEERPGAYIFLGIGEGRPNVHHPEYDFNDEAIPAGCSWLAHQEPFRRTAGRHHRLAPRPAREPGDPLRHDPHGGRRGREAEGVRLRQHRDRRRPDRRGRGHQGENRHLRQGDRPARRHGRAADPGGDGTRLRLQDPWRNACLRP